MKKELQENSVCENGGGWVRGPLLGNGGFGSVYLATKKSSNPFLPQVMAVKSVSFSHSIDLLKEELLLSDLRGCPNIIQCFGDDFTKTNKGDMIFNIFLEYASGGTLDDLIKKSKGRLPELTVRHYTRSILQGLRYIHECNIVHCDLKPENILAVPHATSCGTEFILKIADFGVAKNAKGSKDNNLRGTPMYLSPEAIIHQIQEQPSDIWALGCVVLKMLTGKPPWDMKPGYKIVDLMCRIGCEHESPVIPFDISNEGKDFLRSCLARNPEDRWSAASLLDHPFVSKLTAVDKKHMSWVRRVSLKNFFPCKYV